ncbi:hypothetical protein R2083_02820 [Nitrosomonas sp. Is35]|uniref:hypothetical protein n=1 Tax=Nitrosomonas sp. Is35 TaxID=3080534 RepID=UPI00294B85F4|nr:hypothetical protein [Nitrosomonas sp. Is35]MDV6346446.1 hypothetical protein [Nitrosomonas sp. Is35]
MNNDAAKYDRQQRKELAIEFKDLFESLDKAIPSLKPSEQEWINQERNNVYRMEDKVKALERLSKLEETVEFQQEFIKKHIQKILEATNCIIQAQEIRREIYCWSQLSYSLTEETGLNYALTTLEKWQKIYISKERGKKGLYLGDLLKWDFYGFVGRNIISSFVIPYLARELKN